MPGGLLNIVAYGAANIILNGNPNKTFFKATYRKYTNFGLQRFNLNYEGQRNLSFDTDTTFEFKVKRYAELLWDTYIVVNLPDIWSPFYGRSDLWERDPPINAIPYEFQWIRNLGFNMIRRVTIHSGGTILDQYSGEWMANVVARDEGSKRLLINRMIGNIAELNNPAYAFSRQGAYPNAVYSGDCENIEPSIRGRQLYIPLLAWFCFSSKLALPLVALQYQEIFIRVEFRPVKELFTIRYVEQPESELVYSCPNVPGLPTTGLGRRIAPNTASVADQLWRFIQAPPPPAAAPGISTESADGWKTWLADWRQYANKRNDWNTDIHLVATYVFLGNDERRQFAAKDHQYLVRSQYQYDFHNATGSQRVKIRSNNMISSYMFRWRRSDVNVRNEWSNYSNWPYQDVLPTTLFGWDPEYKMLIPDLSSTPIFNDTNPMGWLVTGCRDNANIKNILIDLGVMMGGEYRENTHRDGVYNFIEKFKRTTGDARDGLYMYNFAIDTNRMVYQPSGAQNVDKWQHVIFEFQTVQPPPLSEDCNGNATNIDIMCDPSGGIIGVRKDFWRLNEYNYDLRVFEERYNIVRITGGLVGLMYAR